MCDYLSVDVPLEYLELQCISVFILLLRAFFMAYFKLMFENSSFRLHTKNKFQVQTMKFTVKSNNEKDFISKGGLIPYAIKCVITIKIYR